MSFLGANRLMGPNQANDGALGEYPRSKLRQALEVCHLLYNQSLSGSQVAATLGLTPASVTRLKQDAERLGLVRTVVVPPRCVAIESELKLLLRASRIRDVVVCLGNVGDAAARYVESASIDSATFVLDAGNTIAELVESLDISQLRITTAIPLAADPPSYPVSAYENTIRLATRCRSVRPLKLPYYRTRPLRDQLHQVQTAAKNASVVALGVGPWKTGYTALEFVKHIGLSPQTLLRRYPQIRAAVGYCAVDHKGRHVALPEISSRMQRSLSFAQMKSLANSEKCISLLVAGGQDKAEAVLAALHAQVTNVLIADETLAMRLTELCRNATS